MSEALIIGCGYVGTRLARHLLEVGHTVTALVRSDESKTRLSDSGCVIVQHDLDHGGVPPDLAAVDWLFWLAPIAGACLAGIVYPLIAGSHD